LDEIADACKTAIDAALGTHSYQIQVAESPDIETNDRNSPMFLTTRSVFIIPLGYENPEMATRSEDVMDYRIGIVVCERYTGMGAPPQDWLRERKQWVAENIYDVLLDQRAEPILDKIWPQAGAVTVACDPEMVREHKIFWSEIEVTFREIV
jgi:hypothetical protein